MISPPGFFGRKTRACNDKSENNKAENDEGRHHNSVSSVRVLQQVGTTNAKEPDLRQIEDRKISPSPHNKKNELEPNVKKLRHRAIDGQNSTNLSRRISQNIGFIIRHRFSVIDKEKERGHIHLRSKRETGGTGFTNNIANQSALEEMIQQNKTETMCSYSEYLVYTWVLSLIALATTLKLYFLVKTLLAVIMVVFYASCILIFHADLFATSQN